jgi:hypothetical protein
MMPAMPTHHFEIRFAREGACSASAMGMLALLPIQVGDPLM